MANRLKVPHVKVDGTAIDAQAAEALVEVRVEQTVNVPGSFTLRFNDPFFELFDAGTFAPAKAIVISFRDEDSESIVHKGEITAIGIEPSVNGRHDLVVSGLDKAHKLARGSHVQTFLNQKDSDIVKKVAQAAGLSCAADATSKVHDYLLQEADDYRFIDQRARANGFDWWVDDSTLHFKKRPAGTPKETTWGEDLLAFRVRISSGTATTDATVRSWDPDTQKAVVGSAKPAGSAAELGSSAPAAANGHKAMKAHGAKRFAPRATVVDKGEADALAQAAVQRGVGDEVIARGEMDGDPDVKAGTNLDVKGMGTKLSGKYYLTRVEHVYSTGTGYVTRFVAGGREPNGLADLIQGGRPASTRTALGATLLIGVVSNLEDPDKLGRIKVKLPALADDAESDWARVLGPGAGPSRGLEIIPEINDEVLVGFEHGDLRRPVVIGGLWSKKNGPPLKTGDAVKSKKVVSRVLHSRLGHKVELLDGTSAKDKAFDVTLSDGKTALHLGEDKVTLDAPTDIVISGDKNIKLTAGSNYTLEAMQITIKAKQKLVLDAPQVEIKGSATVKVEGAKVDVKASGMLNAEASGIASVKGSLLKLN